MTKQMKVRILGIIAVCVVVALALVSGVGYASGAFSQDGPQDEEKSVSTQQSSTEASSSASSMASSDNNSSSLSSSSSAAAEETAAPAGQAQAEEPRLESEEIVVTQVAPEQAEATVEAAAPAQPEYSAPQPVQPATISVSVSIDSSRAASKGYPSSMGSARVQLSQGASVYDALLATGAAVGGSSGYVSSIGGLAEFACGQGSGWLYFVNGTSPGIGCGSYTLEDGDSVTWIYTMDMGKDV